MKTIFTLLLAALFSISTRAQFTNDFETGMSGLTGNCWVLTQMHHTNEGNVAPISGTGSLYTNPLTGPQVKNVKTPYLQISAAPLSIAFKYKLTSALNSNATRLIEVGLENSNGVFTLLQSIVLDNSSPVSVLDFNQSFSIPSATVSRVAIRMSGANGDGSARLVLDDLQINANAYYGPAGNCNSAPVAVNDVYSGLNGSVINGNVMNNDQDPNNEPMTATVVTPSPDGTVVLNPSGSFIFTPNAGFTGSTSFTYRLLDAGYDPAFSNIATVTINYFAPSPLPVKLISFDAKYSKPDVQLNWSTAQEKNFSHFELEQSTNGIQFRQIALIFGAGESDSKLDYQFTDKNLAGQSGLVYYRLKSVDIDNKSTYSSVRIIRLSEEKQGLVLATYPNPVVNEVRITVPAVWQNKKVTYEILNFGGQVTLRMDKGNSSQTEVINMSQLSAGVYIVRASCEGVVAQQKVVKQ